MTEEAFKAWKEQTRQEALEKEVKRLRERSYKQSGKIGSLRRTVYFSWFFFIVLFAIMLFKGMISLNGKQAKPETEKAITKQEKKVVKATTDSVQQKNTAAIPDSIVPIKNTKGILYCVQIGAFTGLDLDEFKGDLVSLQQDSYDGINQLTLGRFKDYKKAVRFLNIVHQIGFHDAFIMTFKDGKRVPMNTMQKTVNNPQKPAVSSKKEEIPIPYVVPEEEPIGSDSLSGGR